MFGDAADGINVFLHWSERTNRITLRVCVVPDEAFEANVAVTDKQTA